MNPSTASSNAQEEPAQASSLYRAVWRWHFYAGLVCLPLPAMMAVTGGARSLTNALANAKARLPASRLVKLSTFDGHRHGRDSHHPRTASGAKP